MCGSPGLFDQPLAQVRDLMQRHLRRGQLRQLQASDARSWLGPPRVILRHQTALELGGPSRPSCAMLLWDDRDPGQICHGRVSLLGPDLPLLEPPGAPLALVLLAAGPEVEADAVHDHCCQLRDAVGGIQLRGTMARMLPSQQNVWYRLDAGALCHGLDAALLGGALIQAAVALPFVHRAEVLLVTHDVEAIQQLSVAARLAAGISETLSAIHEGLEMNCDGCQYQAVCELVEQLREAHQHQRT